MLQASVATWQVNFPPQPHLVEHRELHPGLEVGCDISELIKAALLLLTHAVIKCCRALRHTICNTYTVVNKSVRGSENILTRWK